MSAILSFLGGTAFRMIFGQVSDWINKRQDHQHELDAMRTQAELDKQRHAQDCERLRLQADLGVKEVMVQTDGEVAKLEAQAFAEAMKTANAKTGVAWVDAWNGCIRPLCATLAVGLWVFALVSAEFKLGDWDKELIGVVLGFFFASRALIRGKQ